MLTGIAIGVMVAVISVLAVAVYVLHQRLNDLETWREEVEGDDEPYTDTSGIATREEGFDREVM